MADDDRLRLIALDEEDLQVLSAHLQDAVLRVENISWLPRDKHFMIVVNRFVWETVRGRRSGFERRRAALRLARVEKVQSLGIDRSAKATVLELLAMRFEPSDAPSGDVVLDFAGGATIRLSVEVLEAELADLGPAWSTPVAPSHRLG